MAVRAREEVALDQRDDVGQHALDRGAQQTECDNDPDDDHAEDDRVLGHRLAGLVMNILRKRGEKLAYENSPPWALQKDHYERTGPDGNRPGPRGISATEKR